MIWTYPLILQPYREFSESRKETIILLFKYWKAAFINAIYPTKNISQTKKFLSVRVYRRLKKFYNKRGLVLISRDTFLLSEEDFRQFSITTVFLSNAVLFIFIENFSEHNPLLVCSNFSQHRS